MSPEWQDKGRIEAQLQGAPFAHPEVRKDCKTVEVAGVVAVADVVDARSGDCGKVGSVENGLVKEHQRYHFCMAQGLIEEVLEKLFRLKKIRKTNRKCASPS